MDSEDSGPEEQHGQDDDQQQPARSPAQMVSSFISHAPPGQINEVLTDVRGIVDDEELVREQVARVLPQYIRKQLTPVKLDETSEHGVLLTNFNDLDNGRYADPRTKQSFAYDYLSGQVSDIQAWEPDSQAEPWRAALETEWTKYTREHYHEGTGSVFSSMSASRNPDGNSIVLNACLEGHQFQPKKFWNGRWRSIWTVSLNPTDKKPAKLNGLVKLHVHYYEDGNVQLVSSKNCDQTINITVSCISSLTCNVHAGYSLLSS